MIYRCVEDLDAGVCIEAYEPGKEGTISFELRMVEDHLEAIVNAMNFTLNEYTTTTKGHALDFSNIRKRGSSTSHAGIATGPVSFIKALDDLITPLSSLNRNAVKPIAVLVDTHPDFKEMFLILNEVKSLTLLRRSGDWKQLSQLEALPVAGVPLREEDVLKPNWHLTKEELQVEKERRRRMASPFKK